jgi:hypothetical protein
MGIVQMLPFLESAEVAPANAPLHNHSFVQLLRKQCAEVLPGLLKLDVPHGILHGDIFLENTV